MHEHQASPLTAAVALGAAALGLAAHLADGATHLFAMPSPDDITSYTRAICISVAMVVNLAVGSFHAAKILWTTGRAVVVRLRRGGGKRRKRGHPAAPPAPGAGS